MVDDPYYRLYLLNSAGNIIGNQELRAKDDEAALLAARDLRHWQAVEVWNLSRLVGRVMNPPDGLG